MQGRLARARSTMTVPRDRSPAPADRLRSPRRSLLEDPAIMHHRTHSVTRSATSRSCSMMIKPIWLGSALRIWMRSRRSVGDRPAAGSSNRMKRGAPASASAISSWRCWPWLSVADQSSRGCVRAGRRGGYVRPDHGGVVASRAQQRKAPARDAAAGEIDRSITLRPPKSCEI